MSVSPERIEEAREKIRRAVEDGERLYRKGMHDPDGLSAKDDFRLSGILSLDLPDALGAFDRLAAALREARERAGRLREALEAISDRGDFEPFDDRCAPVLIAIARDALAVSPPADEAKR